MKLLQAVRAPGRRGRLSRIVALLAAVALIVSGAIWYAGDDEISYRTEARVLRGASGPRATEPARLDTTVYVPETATSDEPAPAVLLAHGFGGSKHTVEDTAADLAGRGYVVLTFSARGFGRSTGLIHLNHPDYEVADARRLLDWLATRPDVLRDRAGDPRVAVTGASYGGALALLLAGHDRRVDAIVPQSTWHDLADAFLPESTGAGAPDGVFKRAWAGLFFGTASTPGAEGLPGMPGSSGSTDSGDGAEPNGASGAQAGTPSTAGGPGGLRGRDPTCGRFAPAVCRAYLGVATTGRPSRESVDLLRASSPATVLDRITAPTLLIQGTADTLFPLSQADANASGIRNAPVRLAWFSGGHDGEGSKADEDRVEHLTTGWLDHHLRGMGEAPGETFTYSRTTGVDASNRGPATSALSAERYPGLRGERSTAVTVAGPPQPVANPPGGSPAALSSLPGLPGLSGMAVSDLPGQHASYVSEPLTETVDVVGAPRVSIRAASPTGEAVLFVKLYDVSDSAGRSLPDNLVAPVRLTGLPRNIADAKPVQVTLPAIVHRFDAGHRLNLVVATSDQAFATPSRPTVYTVGLGAPEVTLPQVDGAPLASPTAGLRQALVILVAVLLLGTAVGVVVGRWRHRRRDHRVAAGYADVPLVVRNLRKEYADGFVAVAKVDFTVGRGQVVGLLGPNGAGKTTTLRTLLGLIQPTAGDVLVFGHRLVPGAPVLSRLGALVEGPGFLPHLSGTDNLALHWRATGRPWSDARFDEVLSIAGLGAAVHRKVRTYSHGMKQRLAIAQAMLGMPELLVLDEPTDGLDPPQIAEMRRVLREYAGESRAVLVSSHLLAEVEQTCSHVVVMHRGELVASGPVEDVVGDSPTVLVDVTDPTGAEQTLRSLAGVTSVGRDGTHLVVTLDGAPRTEAVAALVQAGIGVQRVVPRRRLEDAFLSLVGGPPGTATEGDR